MGPPPETNVEMSQSSLSTARTATRDLESRDTFGDLVEEFGPTEGGTLVQRSPREEASIGDVSVTTIVYSLLTGWNALSAVIP